MEKKQAILIVDDTPENLQVLGNLLETDYEVRIATNGIDAISTVEASPPDLILLDILLPHMSGYEVCRQIKAMPEFRIIPIIFISALGMAEQKVEAFREGAVDYITKPFQAEEVLARVRTHLQLSKTGELKHEIAERKKAEELLKIQNTKLEAQHEEYRQLNEKLLQSNADLEIAKTHAEESDRLKTAFLQNISHEIRTPLNGIVGFSDLLLLDGLTSEKIESYTGIIKKSCDRLMATVNNILDISKIEVGQIVIYKKQFSLNTLISDLYDFHLPAAKEKGLELKYHNSLQDSNCLITSDDSKIHQILTNLIINAIKFSKKGTINFGYEINNEDVMFFVKDTGIGISPEMKEKIFDRFTQGDYSISRGYEGAGLGLSISKGLVTLLGGTLWLKSEVNIGSDFYFTIPFSTTHTAENNKKTEILIPQSELQAKILIVEDDIVSVELLKEIFAETKFTILHAENGEIAVFLAKNAPDIDIVLMDMKMPVMDGFESTKQIKKIRPELPIIAQSAYYFKEEKDKILLAGCNDYISKPIDKNKIIELIYKYLNK